MPFNGFFHTPTIITIIIIYIMWVKSRGFNFESGFICSFNHDIIS